MGINKNQRCLGCNNTIIWIMDKKDGWCPECGTKYTKDKKRVIVNIPNSVNRRKFYPINEDTENNEYKLIVYEYKG